MSKERVPELTSVRSPPRISLEYDQLKDDRTHIGSGGQGAVYRVNISSPRLPEQVAVKEPEVDSDTVAIDDVEALLDEADTWETLDRREREKPRWDDSEYIVGIIDIGEENFPWIAMEYMDGGGLDRRLKAYPNGGPVNTALWIGECICQGVEVAHNYGIAHLDLKPSNILFRKTGENMWDVPKIADWGLSRVLTEQTGAMEKLSVQYAAPEQVEPERFGEPDMLTDVYQVGALTYAMVTGDPPYAGKQASVLHDIVSSDSPTPPSEVRDDLPPTIDEVVLKAIKREKTDRYRNIGEFEKAIHSFWNKNYNHNTSNSKQTTETSDYSESNDTIDVDDIQGTTQTTATESAVAQKQSQDENKKLSSRMIASVGILSGLVWIAANEIPDGSLSDALYITSLMLMPIIGGVVAGWKGLSFSAPVKITGVTVLSLTMLGVITGAFAGFAEIVLISLIAFGPSVIAFKLAEEVKKTMSK